MKILFADDDQAILDIYKSEMEFFLPDFTFNWAVDGEDAHSQCQKIKFDLIITDGKMPRLDGIELAKKLTDEKYNTPIIMITGHHHLVDEIDTKEIGIDKVLDKPINFDELVEIIKDYGKQTDPVKT